MFGYNSASKYSMNQNHIDIHKYLGGNIREVIKISIPLILASAGHAINLFADRIMLAHYSQEAVSAAFPAGLTAFTLSCFFFGTVGYTNAFVAQYYGAKSYQRVGTSVWQGIFLAIIGGAILGLGYFFASPLFSLFGHDPKVLQLEIDYFQILSLGTIFPLAMTALAAFWGGRGRTIVIMINNLLVTGINISCNYILIFGKTFTMPIMGEIQIPRLGIEGAAWGTVISGAIGMLIFLFLFLFNKKNREIYQTCSHIFDWDLFKRMIYYGAPNGIQLFLDLSSFNVFAILLGLISIPVQEAASIVFALNSIAFHPMIGLGQTVAILVGQSIGEQNIKHAKQSIRSGRFLIILSSLCMLILFTFFSEPILELFARTHDSGQLEAFDYARKFLYFISAYLLFDGIGIIYGNAIKSAGDTKFVMWVQIVVAWGFFAIPCILCQIFGGSVWWLWSILVLYIILLAIIFYTRYRMGQWKYMKVIEFNN